MYWCVVCIGGIKYIQFPHKISLELKHLDLLTLWGKVHFIEFINFFLHFQISVIIIMTKQLTVLKFEICVPG